MVRDARLTAAVLVALGVVLGSGVVQAAPVYGTSILSADFSSARIAASGGLTMFGGYLDGATLTWDITSAPGGYAYSYEFAVAPTTANGWSHFILDFSDNCSDTGGCFLDLDFDGALPAAWGTYTTNGNPGFPGTIVGYKWNADTGGGTSLTFSFFSPRVPVYGDFYSKGGNPATSARGWAVWNTGAGDHTSGNTNSFVAVPDTQTVVPEPASLVLLGSGLIGVAYKARRRK